MNRDLRPPVGRVPTHGAAAPPKVVFPVPSHGTPLHLPILRPLQELPQLMHRALHRTLRLVTSCVLLAALAPSNPIIAQSPPTNTARYVPAKGLSLSLWAREPMVQDPVALSFDDQGRLYVAETARRGTVDIDIRSHQPWLIEDLANSSVEDLRRFFRFRMAPERSADNAKWLPDHNRDGSHDWRDLMGIKERVRRLEDPAQSGKATHSSLFAEGFNEEIGGVLAGVLPWGDTVFATAYPSLWRLRDPLNTGKSVPPESLFRGFGVHAAFDGHDLHGLIVGPDGKIYFSVGDNGFSVPTREGRQLHYPNTGGVLRMNPDGSELEVFATGLRNVQEIAFDEFGNCFGVDNDGDLADERERFVYIVEGSDSGWRLHWQFKDAGWSRFTQLPNYNPWVHERMWIPHHPDQPAHITPPLSNYSVGPGSLVYNPGTALNDSYKKHFFLIQFPVQKVSAFQTRPKGAGFEMVGEHTALSGMMASGVSFGPDGALYVADWDGMWNPNGTGAIWRLDDTASAGSTERLQVKRILAQGMRERNTHEILQLLDHPDSRLRLRAQFELVRRHESRTLLEVATDKSAPRLARIHALWGIGQLKEKARPESLPFHDSDPEIRAQTAKIAGDLRLTSAAPILHQLLGDARPRVRAFAATALSKAGSASSIPNLVRLLVSNDDQDAFIRHACVLALSGIGKPEPLAELASHPSKPVRIAAILALRRLHSPLVARFLTDSNVTVRREAIRAIHDDSSIPSALPALASLLPNAELNQDEAASRRVLSAAYRLGRPEDASALLQYALSDAHPEPLRVEALECLAAWDRTPELDRVEGSVRRTHPKDPSSARLGRRLIQENLEALFRQPTTALAETLARHISQQSLSVDPNLLTAIYHSERYEDVARIQALQALLSTHFQEGSNLLQSALQQDRPPIRLAAVRLLAATQPDRFASWLPQKFNSLSIPEKQLSLSLLKPQTYPSLEALLTSQAELLLRNELPKELALDVLQAVAKRATALTSTPSHPLAKLANQLKPQGSTSDTPSSPQLPEALFGGDPRRGKGIFRTHVGAQCVRCHDAGGPGKQVGPVLTGIASRVSREYLLESLIAPSAQIAQGFETLSITLSNGDVLDGIKLHETSASIIIQTSEGEKRTVTLSDISSRSTNKLSSMPPMLDILTPFEIRDLVAFLSELK